MKTNILSVFIFICATAVFLIMKYFYIEGWQFNVPGLDDVDRIRSINDIDHLKSVAEGEIAIHALTAKTYNKMLVNSVDVFLWLSFSAAMFSFFAFFEEKRKIRHSNNLLHSDAARLRR